MVLGVSEQTNLQACELCVNESHIPQNNMKSSEDKKEIFHEMFLMWDYPLYAVTNFYYHWLIMVLLQPMASQDKARPEIQTEI